jgi:hypothetical protein
MQWQQIPSIAEVGEVCLESGNLIFGVSPMGNYHQWVLFRRLADGSLEPGGTWAQTGGPNIPRGLGWAEKAAAEKGWQA